MLTEEEMIQLLRDVSQNRSFIDRMSKLMETFALKLNSITEKINMLFDQIEEIDNEIDEIKK